MMRPGFFHAENTKFMEVYDYELDSGTAHQAQYPLGTDQGFPGKEPRR